MLIYQRKGGGHSDAFGDEASQLLVQAVMAYLCEECGTKEQNLHGLLQLIGLCQIEEYSSGSKTPLDRLMYELGEKNEDGIK